MIRKIFGKDYPVIKKALKAQNLEGYFTGDVLEIEETLTGAEETQTELHEFFHAVNERLGFVQTSISEDLWELIVENYARALVENYEIKPKS